MAYTTHLAIWTFSGQMKNHEGRPMANVATEWFELDGGLATYAESEDYNVNDPTSPDYLRNLKLSGKTKNALIRAGVYTISALVDLAYREQRPHIRNVGEKGWSAIAEALSKPVPRE